MITRENSLSRAQWRQEYEDDTLVLKIVLSFYFSLIAVAFFGQVVLGWHLIPVAHATDFVSPSQIHSHYAACVYLRENPGSITGITCK